MIVAEMLILVQINLILNMQDIYIYFFFSSQNCKFQVDKGGDQMIFHFVVLNFPQAGED
jgi:hypothetical protein